MDPTGKPFHPNDMFCNTYRHKMQDRRLVYRLATVVEANDDYDEVDNAVMADEIPDVENREGPSRAVLNEELTGPSRAIVDKVRPDSSHAVQASSEKIQDSSGTTGSLVRLYATVILPAAS